MSSRKPEGFRGCGLVLGSRSCGVDAAVVWLAESSGWRARRPRVPVHVFWLGLAIWSAYALRLTVPVGHSAEGASIMPDETCIVFKLRNAFRKNECIFDSFCHPGHYLLLSLSMTLPRLAERRCGRGAVRWHAPEAGACMRAGSRRTRKQAIARRPDDLLIGCYSDCIQRRSILRGGSKNWRLKKSGQNCFRNSALRNVRNAHLHLQPSRFAACCMCKLRPSGSRLSSILA